MTEKILVTSALPYANGPLHLGHIAGAYLPADIYVRYNRLKGNDVIFIGGTDEYGVPITVSAKKENTEPQKIVDKYHDLIKTSMKAMNIDFDNFSGTSREIHTKISQQFFLDLIDNGYVNKKVTKQLYCSKDKMFLPDRYVEGTCPKCGFELARGDECPSCGSWLEASELKEAKCALCQTKPVEKETTHWFLKLDKMQPDLEDWINSNDKWKDNVLNFVKGWFKAGLRERPITRDLSWGVPVPLDEAEGKVLYVWFDAPIGYLSSTIEWSEKQGNPDRWKDYWLDKNTKLIHFIGKDNIPFHTIVWPSLLMGQKEHYIMPYDVPANEHLNIEGQKLSTSKGNVIWVDDAVEKFHVDFIRYYLASNAPEKKDADFSFKDFQQKSNKDLCDVFGNLVNRTFTFIRKNYDNTIPERKELSEDDKEFISKMEAFPKAIDELYKTFHVREACHEIMNCARLSNKYFDAMQPWNLIKSDKEKCGTVLNLLANAIRMIATLISPITPVKAQELINMIGLDNKISSESWKTFEDCDISGQKLGDVKRLFNKLEDKVIAKEIEKLEKKMQNLEKKEKTKMKEEITFEDFMKIDLRVAEIIEAEKIEKSKKLVKLQVQIGDDKRQIVAGIAKHYNAEDLVGKSIIVVANLKEAKLMGELSQGMLLAAKNSEDGLALISPEKSIKNGSEVG